MHTQEKKEAKRHAQEELSLARKASRMGMLMQRFYRHEGPGRKRGIDPLRGQGRVLALLAAKPTTTQRELSYVLDMRQQSLSELLAKLEDKGYVTREKSEEDGRVTVVRLTEAGAEAAPSAEAMHHMPDAFDCLEGEERAEFERLVDKVIASLEEKLIERGDDPYAPPRPPRGPRPCGPRGEHGERHGFDPQQEHLHRA